VISLQTEEEKSAKGDWVFEQIRAQEKNDTGLKKGWRRGELGKRTGSRSGQPIRKELDAKSWMRYFDLKATRGNSIVRARGREESESSFSRKSGDGPGRTGA